MTRKTATMKGARRVKKLVWWWEEGGGGKKCWGQYKYQLKRCPNQAVEKSKMEARRIVREERVKESRLGKT